MFYITGFKPFTGRAKNGSETLVNSLSRCPSLKHINFKVLDVSWDRFDLFFQEIESLNISGIIGMGEGQETSIAIERIGRNRSSGTDEFGVIKEDVRINPELESTNHSRIRIPASNRTGTEDSYDAGSFLCNYELFHINTLNTHTSAFIHLPPQQDMPDDEYVESLQPTITEIVLHNFMPAKPAHAGPDGI